jgi:ribosome-associated protein
MDVKINTEFIKLDSFLKWCGAVGLGSEAKAYILEGLVTINGEVVLQRGKKVYPGDVVAFNGETFRAVKEDN